MGVLEGKVAVVTGAAQGIGAAYALGLAKEGARVLVGDVADIAASVAAIEQAGGTAMGRRMDVTSDDSINAAIKDAVDAWGRLDILVNNAALFGDVTKGPFHTLDQDEWDTVMRINVRGLWQCAKAAVPEMQKNKYGKIINISSGSIYKGMPNMLHYVTSKGAVLAFTRALAREVGDDNICVNTLAPGFTESEKVQRNLVHEGTKSRDLQLSTRAFKRIQMPGDLVGAVVFLSSPASDFITGQSLVVDGGSAMN